jgi:cobalamin synthase
VAGDARRGVVVLAAVTPVLAAAVGVAITLATDGKHSWWAWVLVGVATVVSAVVAGTLARRQRASESSSGTSLGSGRPGRVGMVDARGAQGVQTGDHSSQHNAFNNRPSS